MRGAGERDVAFARHKTGGGIEPDPAGTRQVDFGPSVQIGKVGARAGRAFDRDLILYELYQIARDKTTGKTQQAQRLHQQPRAVAAAPRATTERLGRGLHTDLLAQRVLDVGSESLIQRNQKIDRFAVAAVHALEPASKCRAVVLNLEIGLEVGAYLGGIVERIGFGLVIQEKIERVDRHHVDQHFDIDAEVIAGLGKYQPREVVPPRILLPVEEVIAGRDVQ